MNINAWLQSHAQTSGKGRRVSIGFKAGRSHDIATCVDAVNYIGMCAYAFNFLSILIIWRSDWMFARVSHGWYASYILFAGLCSNCATG